jgi:hypothetical protein
VVRLVDGLAQCVGRARRRFPFVPIWPGTRAAGPLCCFRFLARPVGLAVGLEAVDTREIVVERTLETTAQCGCATMIENQLRGRLLLLIKAPQMSRTIIAPTIAPSRPAPSPGLYQPKACPR